MRREVVLPNAATEALDLLYQHRLLSTPQLRELLISYTERSVVRFLDRLADRELVRSVRALAVRGGWGHRLWFLTSLGADIVEAIPDRAETRRRLLTPTLAAGQLQAHTLAVNDVGLAFIRAARERDHDFGPRSWRHEVAHDLGRQAGRRRGQVIADSVLRYWMPLPRGRTAVRYRFVELDRANRLVDDVAGKLARYALLRDVWGDHRGANQAAGDGPDWPTLYRHFPGIIVVLANPARANLQRRRANLLALCRADPQLRSLDGVSVSVVFFDELMSRGPFAPIFWRLVGDRPVDWLGREESQDGS